MQTTRKPQWQWECYLTQLEFPALQYLLLWQWHYMGKAGHELQMPIWGTGRLGHPGSSSASRIPLPVTKPEPKPARSSKQQPKRKEFRPCQVTLQPLWSHFGDAAGVPGLSGSSRRARQGAGTGRVNSWIQVILKVARARDKNLFKILPL